MAASPFAFYRGAAAVMAEDLANTPSTGLITQLCGDAHAANFGVSASPERALLFDVNDFDETHRGPFEWDVKRLAASLVLAGAQIGLDTAACHAVVLSAVGTYRARMRDYAGLRDLEVWYTLIDAAEIVLLLEMDGGDVRAARRSLDKARLHTSLEAMHKLTDVVDGERRFVDNPPLLEHTPGLDENLAHRTFHEYRQSLEDDRRHLLERYRIVDTARKVVGVGSVGTRCYVALLQGRDHDDPLILQVKQAERSVLEPHSGRSPYRNSGRRVVAGQRLMQAASDIFLGWGRDDDGHDYYWRQLHDMKWSADLTRFSFDQLNAYGRLCASALARAHARAGNRVAIATYLGKGDRFDRAIADFSLSYAEQAQKDHQAFLNAIASGRIAAGQQPIAPPTGGNGSSRA
jgi:uncharacterized protein (DUF2252 family)